MIIKTPINDPPKIVQTNHGSSPICDSSPITYNLNQDDKILLFHLRKFPWLTRDLIDKYFYENIHYEKQRLRRVRNLVNLGLINKWEAGDTIYTVTRKGLNVLNYWQGNIRKFECRYAKAINAKNFLIDYYPPASGEPKFKDFYHSNRVMDIVLSLSGESSFDIVEGLDFVRNKRESLFINNYPDILLMKFTGKYIMRVLIEVESSEISKNNLVRKIVRHYEDNELNSGLARQLEDNYKVPVKTRHVFLGTNRNITGNYIRKLRQFFGVNFNTRLSPPEWERLRKKQFNLQNYESRYKFRYTSLAEWIRSKCLFFGEYDSMEDFRKAVVYTFDHDFYFKSFPVEKNFKTIGGQVSFKLENLFR